MNQIGLGILISTLTTARKNSGDLVLCCISEKIESLLTATKLITVFKTFDSEEEALQHFK